MSVYTITWKWNHIHHLCLHLDIGLVLGPSYVFNFWSLLASHFHHQLITTTTHTHHACAQLDRTTLSFTFTCSELSHHSGSFRSEVYNNVNTSIWGTITKWRKLNRDGTYGLDWCRKSACHMLYQPPCPIVGSTTMWPYIRPFIINSTVNVGHFVCLNPASNPINRR